jgi:hypothetical protein
VCVAPHRFCIIVANRSQFVGPCGQRPWCGVCFSHCAAEGRLPELTVRLRAILGGFYRISLDGKRVLRDDIPCGAEELAARVCRCNDAGQRSYDGRACRESSLDVAFCPNRPVSEADSQTEGTCTNFSASAGEANGPTNLPECLFLNIVPSTHSCSWRYISPLRNSSTSTARFPSSL